MTAMSVVPPPISTIMLPRGSAMSMPAPIAAAIGSSIRNVWRAPASSVASITERFSTSVTPLGTHTMTRGLKNMWRPDTFLIKWLSMRSVISKLDMTPSLSGLMAAIEPGVRPSMARASVPMASMRPVRRSTATTDGSRSTMPLPFTYTRTLDVPRSIPTSLNSNSPIY
ncbi:hypothetical protein SDC9_163519 [bioreactor metagenome]|uniref:Uncharacterized protein n=1 Tax=bioreactor metagenome TaxID=1076179 RepID=A0A645FP29_9ZZZZ